MENSKSDIWTKLVVGIGIVVGVITDSVLMGIGAVILALVLPGVGKQIVKNIKERDRSPEAIKKRIIAFVILCAIPVSYLCIKTAIDLKNKHETKVWCETKRQALETAVKPIANEFEINDMVCESFDPDKSTYTLESEQFRDLTNEEKLEFYLNLSKNCYVENSSGKKERLFYGRLDKGEVVILSQGVTYTAQMHTYGPSWYRYVYADDKVIFEDTYTAPESNTNSSKSSSGGQKCPSCNGTGYVRYYYGASALEAWLSGHEDYTFGKCTMCKGTGMVD